MRKIVIVLGGVGLLWLTACSPSNIVENPESRSTRQAQETARVETAVFVGTQAGTTVALQATVDSAPILGTQLAQLQQESLNLQATIHAATTLGAPVQPRITPTAPIAVAAPLPVAGTTTLGNSTTASYTDIRTASGVDDNGCPVDKLGRFSETVDRVYLTMVGAGITSGTRHQIEWYFGETLRTTSVEWAADQDYDQLCIYFWLGANDTAFEAGLWKANVLINGEFYIEVPFEFCAAGELC